MNITSIPLIASSTNPLVWPRTRMVELHAVAQHFHAPGRCIEVGCAANLEAVELVEDPGQQLRKARADSVSTPGFPMSRREQADNDRAGDFRR